MRPLKVESWKDLQKVAPSSGYLYIDCASEPKLQSKEKTVTISQKWILITEPEEQALYSIDEYSVLLKKYECLRRISFFKHFTEAKIITKWKRAI